MKKKWIALAASFALLTGLWFRYRQRQERICRIGRRFGSTGKESK